VNGEFIVPYEVLELIPANPNTGRITFGHSTHVAWEALNLAVPARLDLVGITSLVASGWVVEDVR
jgi:hypothetical protein